MAFNIKIITVLFWLWLGRNSLITLSHWIPFVKAFWLVVSGAPFGSCKKPNASPITNTVGNTSPLTNSAGSFPGCINFLKSASTISKKHGFLLVLFYYQRFFSYHTMDAVNDFWMEVGDPFLCLRWLASYSYGTVL
ncbi:hypothetical protein SADUNF_Sadunf05G0103100 [Salix dunnii]|uniref:Uncharacterized protein n=1 Tax=Salix dunnii TaxID=1413687 RepID=A0A835KAI8_9ROSI|nr:hypothetical protein SADUNF_Sadunf05G0103100 [Salix dunnii]